MTDNPLRETIARARAGDVNALKTLLVQHLPSVEAYVRLRAGRLVLLKESCTDLVQSVCVQALENLDTFEFRGEGQFRHWLFKQALHKVMNRARHHQAAKRDAHREIERGNSDWGKLSDCYQTLMTPSRHAVGREAVEEFERAFAELPQDYQEAVSLHRLAGLGYPEIAAAMDRSEGAARNLVYRGLARLSDLLDPNSSGA